VIGGPGAFLMVAEGDERFAGAVRRGILREIASVPAADPRATCATARGATRRTRRRPRRRAGLRTARITPYPQA
jgi:hypothetical protein